MNLVEAKHHVALKVISIEAGGRAQRAQRHMGMGRGAHRMSRHAMPRHMGSRRGFRIQKRLGDMGIREGTIIRKVSQQAFRGPIVVEIGRMRLAIGPFMAAAIKVEETE